MALEDLTGPAVFITALVPANPGSADDRREGDDHIRGTKNVLSNSFPAISGAVTATHTQLNAAAAFDPATKVSKAGDTMTGPLDVQAALRADSLLVDGATVVGGGLTANASATVRAVANALALLVLGRTADSVSILQFMDQGGGDAYGGFRSEPNLLAMFLNAVDVLVATPGAVRIGASVLDVDGNLNVDGGAGIGGAARSGRLDVQAPGAANAFTTYQRWGNSNISDGDQFLIRDFWDTTNGIRFRLSQLAGGAESQFIEFGNSVGPNQGMTFGVGGVPRLTIRNDAIGIGVSPIPGVPLRIAGLTNSSAYGAQPWLRIEAANGTVITDYGWNQIACQGADFAIGVAGAIRLTLTGALATFLPPVQAPNISPRTNYVDLTGSRAIDTVYTNSNAFPVDTVVQVITQPGGTISLMINGASVCGFSNPSAGPQRLTLQAKVPPGGTVQALQTGATSALQSWREW